MVRLGLVVEELITPMPLKKRAILNQILSKDQTLGKLIPVTHELFNQQASIGEQHLPPFSHFTFCVLIALVVLISIK